MNVCLCSLRAFRQCLKKYSIVFEVGLYRSSPPQKVLLPPKKNQALECSIECIYLSDHEVLITFLSLNNTSALKMWSLGNSWLKVSEFRDYWRQQISFYLELNEASAASPLALWDILKAIIKGQIILYIMERKKDLCW